MVKLIIFVLGDENTFSSVKLQKFKIYLKNGKHTKDDKTALKLFSAVLKSEWFFFAVRGIAIRAYPAIGRECSDKRKHWVAAEKEEKCEDPMLRFRRLKSLKRFQWGVSSHQKTVLKVFQLFAGQPHEAFTRKQPVTNSLSRLIRWRQYQYTNANQKTRNLPSDAVGHRPEKQAEISAPHQLNPD